MKAIPCLCGNQKDLQTVFEQNFSEQELSPANFSARGSHDFAVKHLHYRIVRCGNCGQLFSTPILDDAEIGAHYGNSVHQYEHERDNIIRSYLEPLHERGVQGGDKQRAIEVGCGSGSVLQSLKELGYQDLAGVEPSREAVSLAPESVRPRIQNCLFENAYFEERSADLICAFQVLDHFSDPAAVMRRFFDILRPQGLCYAIIHDEKALHVRLFGERSPIIDVSHIYYFNQKTLKRLFVHAGFLIEDLFPIWNHYTLKTWLRMLPIPAKPMIGSLLRAARLDGVTIALPAGNIGILARKPQ